MKKRMLPILLFLLVYLLWIPAIVSAADNLSIQLDEHLPVTVQPGETISISVDLRNNPSYTWEDCVIILEDSYGLEISGCEGGILYSNTGTKCYVQFKGLPVGSISIRNRSVEEVRTGTVWFSETVPVESFSIGNLIPTDANEWIGRVVGGDTYIGDYSWASSDYFELDALIHPANHQDCYIAKWASSDESVATIDGGGRIQKLQAGKTTITATLSNGMVAAYDFAIVEPEKLYAGYEDVITINPGELCEFIYDIDSPGKYIFYFDGGLPANLYYTYSGEYDPMRKSRNGYSMFIYELMPQDSPFYCSFEYPLFIEDGEPIEMAPTSLSIHFEKAVPIESISLSNDSTGHNVIRWIDSTAYFMVETLPFLSAHEEITYSSSDESVVSISEYGDGYLYCDCLSTGTATITATTENGLSASQEIQVTEPFASEEGFQWTQYGMDNLNIEINSDIQYDFGIYIDDYWVTPKNYTITPGSKEYSIIVSLHRDFLQSLSKGTHEILVYGSGGTAVTTITILDSESNPPFTDVPAGCWYEAPVLWALENGITDGTSDTTFSPGNQCLRAHVVTFLWNAEETPEPAATSSTFTDVPAGAWYYKPVLWAVENGITSGVSPNKFGAGDVCSRYQVVYFLWKAAGAPEPKTIVNPFTDVNPGHFFYKAVLWAVENGITSGTSDTTFSPAQPCNRAQVVTFLYAAYT